MRNPSGHRLLLDTNILLDALCRDRPESNEACRVLRRCNGGGDMGIVSPMSLKDVYYVLRRQYGEKSAREAVRLLVGLVVVAPFGPEECLLSVDSNEPDFEDGLVRACAELNDVDFILTRDSAAFKRSKVRAVSCAEYLDLAGA